MKTIIFFSERFNNYLEYYLDHYLILSITCYEPTLRRLPTRKVFDIVFLLTLEFTRTQPWQQQLRDGSDRLRQTRRFMGSLQSKHDDFKSFDVNEDDYYGYSFPPTRRTQMEDDEYSTHLPAFHVNRDVFGLGYDKEDCPGYLHDSLTTMTTTTNVSVIMLPTSTMISMVVTIGLSNDERPESNETAPVLLRKVYTDFLLLLMPFILMKTQR
eukprot:g83337.t1